MTKSRAELAAEKETISRMGDVVMTELRQFVKLCALDDPPLTCADIAHRMVWTKRDTRWLLNKFKDGRP